MDAVADLLALAIQNAALKEREFLRRERIESLRRLLHTMAGALDVRQVFPEVSAVVRGGLPHDFLVLTAWDESATSSRMYAVAGRLHGGSGFLGADSTQRSRSAPGCSTAIRTSCTTPTRSSAAAARRARWFSRLGARSAVRVPLPLGTGVFGSLFFASRESRSLLRGRHRLRPPHRRPPGARAVASAPGRGGGHGREARGPGGHPDARARGARRRAPRRRAQQAVEGRAGAGHARGADRDDGAAHRRIGHRQGGDRALPAPRLAAQPRAVHRHQLRRAPRPVARVGALRPRARRLHGRRHHQAGSHRTGGRRRALPRRSRRDGAHGAGQAAARARRARVHAPGQHAGDARRHPRDRGDQPRPARGHPARRVPRRPLLPAGRVRDPPAAAARAPRRHPRARRDVPGRDRRDGGPAGRGHLARRQGTAPGLRLAGQRARAAQRHRTRGHPRRRRPHPRRAPAGHVAARAAAGARRRARWPPVR